MVSPAPATVDDIQERVGTMDRAFAGFMGILRGMRAGIGSAGTPAVANGSEVVARTERTIAKALTRFKPIRAAIARFKRDFNSDRAGAIERLSAVFARGVNLNLPNVNWPTRLRRAFEQRRSCEDARASIDKFVALVHRKIGGSG